MGESDAPDVVAEVFAVAVAHPGRIPEDAVPWLYRTAWNVISNAWRAQGRRARPVPVAADAGDVGVDVAERSALLDALATLSGTDREALMLTAWEGLEGGRAAAAAGCSAPTFAVRLHRARRRFEQAMAAAGEEVAR